MPPAPTAPEAAVRRDGSGLLTQALIALALLGGLVQGVRFWWVSDDAYIVFRYSKHLYQGHGLVFNLGERVEGFTDLLWVLWCSLAFPCGVTPETWANVSGIACFGATILLLAWLHRRWARQAHPAATLTLPFAALAAGLHPDWAVYATGGLETSAFTAALVCGFACLVMLNEKRWAPWAAGASFAVAGLLRPDGVLPAFLAGLYVLWRGTPRLVTALRYAGSFLVLWTPAQAWRMAYYGDFFPNTYYAKSANLPYYSQGLYYVWTYVEVYWPLAAVPALWLAWLAWTGWKSRASELAGRDADAPLVVLAGAVALAYTFYVARVGGDFMFSRLLIPATPFALLVLDYTLLRILGRWPALGLAAVLILAGHPFWTAFKQDRMDYGRGISNERLYYMDVMQGPYLDYTGETLRRYFEGLPVRMLMPGSEARVIYRAEVPYALEVHGLTDAHVARQPLPDRGRPGHEKVASPDYILVERAVHFTTSEPGYYMFVGGDRHIPYMEIHIERARVFVLTWHPQIMKALQKRGVQVPDFLGDLDRTIAELDRLSDAEVADLYRKLSNFYFIHVPDPERERAFKKRLAGTSQGNEIDL